MHIGDIYPKQPAAAGTVWRENDGWCINLFFMFFGCCKYTNKILFDKFISPISKYNSVYKV